MSIFNFFGSLLGYLLWFLYTIFQNYGVAIIFFTVILKVVLFPTAVKQQRSMASQAKLSQKQQELQKRYANNRSKYSEELQKLYDKEGVNPSSGCVTSLLPMPIMLGIYWSVIRPLSNTLHLTADAVEQAKAYISAIPEMAPSNEIYAELQIMRNWTVLRDQLTMFTSEEVDKIDFFARGFRFLGLDLLGTPQGSSFSEMLWLIPVLSLVTSVAFQAYTMWVQKKNGQSQQLGCMIAMMLVFPLISVYWSYIFPAAVGFYWIVSSVTSWIQSIIINRFFSVRQLTAMQEARRAVTLAQAEEKLRPLPAETQKQIADRLASGPPQKQAAEKSGKKQGKAKKKSGTDQNNYIGAKK